MMGRPTTLSIALIGLGAASGFLYWKYVGCNAGTCPITSNPANAMGYGALMSILLMKALKKRNEKEKQN